ncbi:MAG TPA: hypothetical protein P5121_03210 [Caldilineaceae bacterium]|nr:hypothetical protein [Caldilineaceae bacterium]
MAENFPPSGLFDTYANEGDNEGRLDLDALVEELAQAEDPDRYEVQDEADPGPSLPIILLSAASAIAGFITALYVAYRELAFDIEISAAIATFFGSMVLGITGASLSAMTRTRAATSNIAFSCGLILLSLLFFGLCLLVGAVGAFLLMMLANV